MKPMYEIRRAKRETEDDLLKKKGVTGIDIGPKIVGGEKTDEPSIRVYVSKKRSNVAAKDRVPQEIDGIKTDVIERTFVLHNRRVPLDELRPRADTGTYDPLQGGISIGPCRVIDGSVYVGTLGAIVKDRSTGNPMLLSNYHVMAVDPDWSVGDTQAQPAQPDGGSCPANVVGTLQRTAIQGTTGSSGPGVDAAVADVSARTTRCSIVDIGDVNGIADATVGTAVRKRGRTTGLTHGTIESIDLTVSVEYDGLGDVILRDQILIEVDSSQSSEFGLSGDSGSVVVDGNNRILGLYFAGNDDGSVGVANPIRTVLDVLDVEVCTGKLVEKKFELEKGPKEFEKKIEFEKGPKEFEKIKDIKEFKEWKEFKEFDKPIKEKERKEIFEGPGGLFDPRAAGVSTHQGGFPGGGFPRPDLPGPEIPKLKEIKEKDLKDFKEKDLKDFKEKDLKDFKEKDWKDKDKDKEKDKEKEIKEIKEKDFEPKQIKEDAKDILEPKRIKEDSKDILEPKRFKEDFKEIREPKQIFEDKPFDGGTGPGGTGPGGTGPGGTGPGGPFDGTSLEQQVQQLSQAVAQLSHFIGRELRPDLQQSSLKQEPDLQGKLQKDAEGAKQAKDAKDTEKGREG